jgi:hypothetical protein
MYAIFPAHLAFLDIITELDFLFTLWSFILSGTAVGWGTVLQAWRLRVRVPMMQLQFFQFTWSFEPHQGPGIYSASNINKYRRLRLINSPPSLSQMSRPAVFSSFCSRTLRYNLSSTLYPQNFCCNSSYAQSIICIWNKLNKSHLSLNNIFFGFRCLIRCFHVPIKMSSRTPWSTRTTDLRPLV